MTKKIEEVAGTRVLLRFEAGKCIHSRNCALSRPDVFVPNVPGEWIHPDAATPEEITELAHACPSGAITFSRTDGGPQETPPIVNLIRIRENGPLAFHGELMIAGEPALRATLCRCGRSSHKPYCDGSHTANDFRATGEPAEQEGLPLAKRDGVLTITPNEDGPLMLRGNFEIVTGTGHTIHRASKAALCRCGGSKNKPYCDGSHLSNGFTG